MKSKPLCQKPLFKCLSPLKLELTRKTCISKGIYSIYSCILKTHNKTAILQYHDFVNSHKFLMWPDNKWWSVEFPTYISTFFLAVLHGRCFRVSYIVTILPYFNVLRMNFFLSSFLVIYLHLTSIFSFIS